MFPNALVLVGGEGGDRVKRLAEARQRTSHWLMREAITQYVDREEKRKDFRLDSQLAWENYRGTVCT